MSKTTLSVLMPSFVASGVAEYPDMMAMLRSSSFWRKLESSSLSLVFSYLAVRAFARKRASHFFAGAKK